MLAVLLSLTGAVYAAWPWLRGRASRAADEPEVYAGEDMENVEKVLRDWSVAAGEVRVGDTEAIGGALNA